MLKKIIIFIILVINGFIAKAQNLFYQMSQKDSIMHFTWDYKIQGWIEIEVTIDNKKTISKCSGWDGFRDLFLATKPPPQIKMFHIKDGKRVKMQLKLTAVPMPSNVK